MNKVTKIIFEYEDGSKQTIEGVSATKIQARINTSGILAGIDLTDEK